MSLSSDGAPMLTMPVAPTNSGGNGGFGWDGNGSWFIIILFLFAFLGWGNNGWGNNGGNSGGVVDGYVLSSDFANIERKMDLINGGLCDGFYAANTTLLNGFAGVNQNMNNGFQTAELSRANQQAALMQQLNAMQRSCSFGSLAWKRKNPAGRTTKSWRRCIPSKTKTVGRASRRRCRDTLPRPQRSTEIAISSARWPALTRPVRGK